MIRRYRVRIDTYSDMKNFIEKANKFPKDTLRISDGKDICVNARSLLGVQYSIEWDKVYLYSIDATEDVYDAFSDFVIED